MIRQLFDSNIQFQLKDGSINVGGYLNVYFNVGTVKAVTYKDADALTANPFDIELDNNGRAVVYADNAYVYRMEVFDRNKNLLWTQNNISLDSGIAIDGTYVMSIRGDQFIAVDSTTNGNAVEYDLSLNDYAVDSINLVNDNTFGNSALYNNIQSTSSYLDDKINTEISNRTTADQYIQDQIDNLDIHNITIEQNGDGNAYTSFTKNGDTYTFNKEAVYLPSANAPVVLAGENVEVSSANINGQMQYTVKANPAGNVTNLISTDETISISATSVGNDVTYDLSVKDIAGDDGAKNYAFLNGEMPVNTSLQALEFTSINTNGIHWNTIDQRLEFGENIKLIDLNYNVEYEIDTANGVTYEDLILYIYSDGQLLEQETFYIDTSKSKHSCKLNKKILNPANLQFSIKAPKNGSVDATIDINDETFKSIAGGGGGGSGSTYYAGPNIEISNDVISGRDWTPELNTKLDITAYTPAITYSAGPNINISDNVISGRDWSNELNTKLDTSAYTPYTAGDGIAVVNSEISVKAGKGLGFDVDKKLEVKVGDGLTYDSENKVITIDSDVSDVVATVNKLKKDLDTQITSNFDMPNIAQVYDFADPSVSTLANGACMLCQSFTIPINHEIRTVSEDADEPTLLGIYAQQAFGHKIMLALYEYTYAKSGEEHGSSTYVGDTGPVDVLLGVNEYPLKNRNPSITELRCDKVYYATLYLPNAARVNGLLLAGAPNYGNQSVPAEPRLSCAVENITLNSQELDMNDPTATLNHYQTYTVDDVTYYNYYIGPWNSGYNERWSAPRFYMQIRNGEFNEPVITAAPFVDLGNVLPTDADLVSELPGFTASTSNTSFRDVTPLANVTITSFEWVDNMPNVAGWAAGNCVYDSGFATNLSNNNNTASDLGSVGTVDGQTMYAHRITFATPLALTANTTYRFLCECFDNSSSYVFSRSTPTNVVHCGNNGWWIDTQNLTRYDNFIGKYNKLTDSNNNSYVI